MWILYRDMQCAVHTLYHVFRRANTLTYYCKYTIIYRFILYSVFYPCFIFYMPAFILGISVGLGLGIKVTSGRISLSSTCIQLIQIAYLILCLSQLVKNKIHTYNNDE